MNTRLHMSGILLSELLDLQLEVELLDHKEIPSEIFPITAVLFTEELNA